MGGSSKRPGEDREIGGLYVAIGTTDDGSEGIVTMMTDFGVAPMMTTTRTGLKLMLETVETMPNVTGEEIRVVRFDRGRIIRAYPAPVAGDKST